MLPAKRKIFAAGAPHQTLTNKGPANTTSAEDAPDARGISILWKECWTDFSACFTANTKGIVRYTPDPVLRRSRYGSSSKDESRADLTPSPFNVCTVITMPARKAHPSLNPLFAAVIQDVPVPGLGPGPGELPRFRTELGPFIGLSVGGGGRGVNGGFGTTQSTAGAIGNLEAAVRLGLGLEGVLNEAGDGLVSLDLGVRLDSASSMKITDDPTLAQAGAITAAIPSRSAYTARLRMPFWLIPGDLLLASPLLAISPDTYTKMAVVASNGGLVPWQSGIATPLGRFQFVLGREVGVAFYGLGSDDRLIIPPTVPGTASQLIDFNSISFDFPILEYRPFRTFSQDQTAGVLVQLYTGFEFPTSVSVVSPAGTPEPDLDTIFHFGIRVTFDWRYYF